MADLHSEQASYREKLLEHLFVGELLRHLWQAQIFDVEILSPEVDNSGYDVVLECNGVLRYIQLKSSFTGSKTARQNLNLRLAQKHGGCVVWMYFDAETLALGPFYWFGGEPSGQFPNISELQVAKHRPKATRAVTRTSVRTYECCRRASSKNLKAWWTWQQGCSVSGKHCETQCQRLRLSTVLVARTFAANND
jgi:hypothetical protein